MKKILLIAFIISSFNCFSQNFEKGNKLFGGSFSFSVFNVNQSGPGFYNAGNIGILPSYSWFIKTNLAMGIRGSIGYNKSTTKFDNGTKRTSSSFATGVSIFIKKYKLLNEKFGIYFDNSIGANYSSNKDKTPPQSDYYKSKTYGANYQLIPGVFYRFSKRFMGEGNIGGVYALFSSGQGNHNYGIGASFLQYFNLGINYLIERKKS